MEKSILKSKTIIFFTLTGLLSFVTFLQATDFKSFLLPLVCHVDADLGYVASSCTDKVIKVASAIVGGLSTAGIWLRWLTSSALFTSVFKPK